MDLTIPMKMFYNVKQRHAICLKFGGRFFTPLTMLVCETKASRCSGIRENLILCLNVLFRAYNLITKRITRSAIIVEINTKDVKLVKTNISSFPNVFWNVKTKY